jgi:hypothetical protein
MSGPTREQALRAQEQDQDEHDEHTEQVALVWEQDSAELLG